METPVERAAEFHLKEYESLRSEIAAAIAETRSLERYAILGTGGVWAWLAANSGDVIRVAWCIPVLFAFFGGIRAWVLMRNVWRATRYVKKLESYFAQGDPPGWEHYLRTDTRGFNFETIALFWLSLFVVTIVVAALILLGIVSVAADPTSVPKG